MKNALDAIPVQYLLAIRFTMGALLLALVCWKRWKNVTKDYLWRGAIIGGCLYLAYSIQTYGLALTTPSKNAFLTAVYCVIVPFLYWLFVGVKPDRYNILAAALCVGGVGLVSLSGDLSVNLGDALTLLCAIFYAAHIVAVAKVSPRKDIYLLTVFQFAFAALYAWIGGALTESFPTQALADPQVILPLCYLGVMATNSGPFVPERGTGQLRPCFRSGDPVSGIGFFGVLCSVVFADDTVSVRYGGGICNDFCGCGMQRGPNFRFCGAKHPLPEKIAH